MFKKFLIISCGFFLLASGLPVHADTACIDPTETTTGQALFDYISARLKIIPLTEKTVTGWTIPAGSTRGRFTATFSDPINSEDCYGVLAVQDYDSESNSLCRINSEITQPTPYANLNVELTAGSPYTSAGYVYEDANGDFRNVVNYLGRYQIGTLVSCGKEKLTEFHSQAVTLAKAALALKVGTISEFSDTENYQFAEAVNYLARQKIANGYPDGTFGSEQIINRAEFTKIVVGATQSSDSIVGSECFTDIGSEWFAPYVCTAKKLGILSGYADGTFRPDAPVNVAEALKIMLGAFGEITNNSQPTTNDVPWYQPFVDTAKVAGIYLNNFKKVDQSLTRGEMAELIYHLQIGTRSDATAKFLVTSPAVDGSTYTTNVLPLKISGLIASGSTITVNGGYTLKSCCSAGQTTWEYNLDSKYGNIGVGENNYEFVAQDASGAEVGRSKIKVIYQE